MPINKKICESTVNDIHYKLPDHFECETTRDIYITEHAVDKWVGYRETVRRDRVANKIRKALYDSRPYSVDPVSKVFKSIKHDADVMYVKSRNYIYVIENKRVVTLYPKHAAINARNLRNAEGKGILR